MSLWTSPSVTAQGNSYSQSRCYPGLSAPSVTHTRIRERQVARQEMGAMEGALNVALSGGKGKKGCGSESDLWYFQCEKMRWGGRRVIVHTHNKGTGLSSTVIYMTSHSRGTDTKTQALSISFTLVIFYAKVLKYSLENHQTWWVGCTLQHISLYNINVTPGCKRLNIT